MKNTCYLIFTCFLLLLSCNEEKENTPTDLPALDTEITINGNIFTTDSVFAYKIVDEYLITFGNNTETLLIGINDTIEGNYEIINNPINIEGDTIYFSEELFNQKSIAIASYLDNQNAYITKKGGTLTITKDEKYNISGKFNFSLVNVNDDNDVLELNNGSFNNITPIKPTVIDELPSEGFDQQKKDVEAALQSVYNSLINTEQQHILVDALYTNQIEDKVFGSFADIKNHTLTSKDETLSKLWNEYYTTIYRANQLLENAHKAYPNDIDGLNTILSQAYVLRAYTYASLINWFGKVPLVLKTASNISDFNPSFNSISEIETQIIIDLEFAIAHLPKNDSNISKVSPDFAKFLLGRIYFNQNNYTKTIENLTTITIPTSENNIYSVFLNTLEDNSIDVNFNRFIKKDELVFGTYTEVLLTLAQAYNQTNKANLAIENLNKTNVNTPITEPKTKDELTEIIFNQWTKELKLDGNRFYILKAFHKAVNVLDIESYQLILPIPESEISANINAEQNPGY